MSDISSLFFIAILPPPAISDAVTSVKQDFAARFGSRKALRIMPHMTLKAPFWYTETAIEGLLRWFALTPVTQQPFTQQLDGYGSFSRRTNPVIYIKPVLNDPLVSLQKSILQHFIRQFGKEQVPQNEYSYSPHVTVAYRDLTFHHFREAWREYQEKVLRPRSRSLLFTCSGTTGTGGNHGVNSSCRPAKVASVSRIPTSGAYRYTV